MKIKRYTSGSWLPASGFRLNSNRPIYPFQNRFAIITKHRIAKSKLPQGLTCLKNEYFEFCNVALSDPILVPLSFSLNQKLN